MPTVDNGVVYVSSTDQYVYALNASNGSLIWRFLTGGTPSSPVIANGIIYFTSGAGDGNIYALNESDGSLVWQLSIGAGGNYSPAVVNGIVYVDSYACSQYCNFLLDALNADNGAIIWQTFLSNSDYFTTPVVSNGTVYVSGSDANSNAVIFALNIDDGSELWRTGIGIGPTSQLTLVNGTIYVSAYYSIRALNGNDGTQIWVSSLSGYAGAPTVNNGIIYVGSESGDVYSLSTSSGSVLWSQTLVGANTFVQIPTVAP